MREGGKGQMCGVLSTGWGHRVSENRVRIELDEERAPELKGRKPLGSGVC